MNNKVQTPATRRSTLTVEAEPSFLGPCVLFPLFLTIYQTRLAACIALKTNPIKTRAEGDLA
jgi:hypothetical protein